MTVELISEKEKEIQGVQYEAGLDTNQNPSVAFGWLLLTLMKGHLVIHLTRPIGPTKPLAIFLAENPINPTTLLQPDFYAPMVPK